MNGFKGTIGELDRAGCLLLAGALADTPRNSESIGPLRAGKARAWVAGDLPDFAAALVQWDSLPEEPVGFGTQPEALFSLLQQAAGWTCIDVEGTVARPLGELICQRLGRPVRYLESMGFQLLRPVAAVRNPAVRELGPADAGLLDARARAEFARHHFPCPVPDTIRQADGEQFTAGALVEGRIVGFVRGERASGKYACLQACILESHRNRGYASAAASLVAEYFQGLGLIPEWSTGINNPASMAVPARLGFDEVFPHSWYVVPDQDPRP